MIMAHINVSNHFKRQENALCDKDSGPQQQILSTGHVTKNNYIKNKK